MLTQEQKQRYLRNTILPEINEEGQEKLLKARVLVIGAGGLGSPAIYYLAAAGVGNIGLVDHDVVELSNLQRQIIHNLGDIDKPKVESAKEKIIKLNPDVSLEIFQEKATLESLARIAKNYDYILDATDNFPTRFVVNEFCFKSKKPLIFAAVKAFSGQVSIFKSYEKNNPCYACFNSNVVGEEFSLPLSEKGILGSVAGTAGSMQASATIKEILGIGDSLVGKLLVFDLFQNNFRKVSLNKRRGCSICKN